MATGQNAIASTARCEVVDFAETHALADSK